jgi:hypothetical protein
MHADAFAVPRPRSTGTWLFVAVLGVPSAIFYLGLASSFTTGMILVALLLLWRFGSDAPSGSRASAIGNRTILQAAILTYLALLIHLGVASLVVPVDVMRAFFSLIPLFLMIAGGGALARALLDIPPSQLDRGFLTAWGVLCTMALIGAVGLGPPTLAAEEWRRPVFPFTEPSHFALAFTPALMYACIRIRGLKYLLVLLVSLAVTALGQSLTLAAGLILVALVSLRSMRFVLLVAPAAVALSQIDLAYYTARLDFSDDTRNLSSLVYLQGWQMIGESLQRSYGLGLGFQQLGLHGTDVPAAELLRALRGGEDLNVLDGGFIFAKVTSEFGIFGLLSAAFLTALAMRSVLILRRVADGRWAIEPAKLMAHCVVVSFLLVLFARGANYFNGTTMLLSAALWLLAQMRSSNDRVSQPSNG